MMKLNRPLYTFGHVFDLCVEGVTGNALFRDKLNSQKINLVGYDIQYDTAATNAHLFSIQPLFAERDSDPVVAGTLTKSELEKLYTQYFVPEAKPARIVYDAIKNSANDKCPFCGGIGSPHNVDHFLPKTHFPQFSVLPMNLVPSCLDCNLGAKGHKFSNVAENQIIHPYADNAHFFEEQWIFANYHESLDDESWYFEFFVNPPPHWTAIDKSRAIGHFNDFRLAEKYGKQAADEFIGTEKQIDKFKKLGLSCDDITEALLEPKIEECTFVNHWRRGMYQAIKDYLFRIAV